MKKLIGIASAIAGVAVLAGTVYMLYKKFCPCCNGGCDVEECGCEGEVCETKAAPHSRGYFNLKRVQEAAESEVTEA